MHKSAIIALLSGLAALLCGCRQTAHTIDVRAAPSPAPQNSLVPQLTLISGGRTVLSWQTPLEGGGYSFAMAARKNEEWSDVRTIASSPNLSLFTADLPGVAELPSGALLAYWELKDQRNGDAYTTTIQTSVSTDEGRTWTGAVQPYGDSLPGQHSFLSWFPAHDGMGLLWLDAREQALVRNETSGHSMQDGSRRGSIELRYAHLDDRGHPTAGEFIDPIACECCPITAAVTAKGPVVVYRGRQDSPGISPSEVDTSRPTVRDIHIARFEKGRWIKPHLAHADNWVINACPDNGPAVDAAANAVAVAWWTRAGDNPSALVAFSNNAGDTFGPAIGIDSEKAEGQVTVALLPGGRGAIVGWLEEGQTWARYVSASGVRGPEVALGRSPRHSRVPRWVADAGGVMAAWTSERDGHHSVEVARLGL